MAISLLVMCSTFISLNGNALTGPRAYFAMARDGLFPAGLCRIHPAVPDARQRHHRAGGLGDPPDARGTALILWHRPDRTSRACPAPSWPPGAKLNKTPLYDFLYTYVIFGANLFYLLAIASVFVLRRTRPDCAPALPDLGLPGHALVSTSSAACAPGQHAQAVARRVAGRARRSSRGAPCLLPS